MNKLEQRKKKLERVKKKIFELQKERRALDSYIRLYEWRKSKKNEK